MHIARLCFPLIVLAGISCKSDDDTVTREDCVEVREHIVDLRLANATSSSRDKARTKTELAKHKTQLVKQAGEPFLAQCLQAKDAEWLACNLKATKFSSLGKCGSLPPQDPATRPPEALSADELFGGLGPASAE